MTATISPPIGVRSATERKRERRLRWTQFVAALKSRQVTPEQDHFIACGDGMSRIHDDITHMFTAAMAKSRIRIFSPGPGLSPQDQAKVKEAAAREAWSEIHRICAEHALMVRSSLLARGGTSQGASRPSEMPRLRQSQTSRRSHRSNGPPSKEDDLSSLRPRARAVEVYRRILGRGERIPVARMDAALTAAGIQPRNGTDMRARRDVGVRTACVGRFQGPHEIWLEPEPHDPKVETVRGVRVVTRSLHGETRAEHLTRHQAAVVRARALIADRQRVTGVAA